MSGAVELSPHLFKLPSPPYQDSDPVLFVPAVRHKADSIATPSPLQKNSAPPIAALRGVRIPPASISPLPHSHCGRLSRIFRLSQSLPQLRPETRSPACRTPSLQPSPGHTAHPIQ